MIDIQATIEKFGYDPNELKPKSNRKVVNICPDCGAAKDIYMFTTARDGWDGLCSTCSPKTERRRAIRSDAMEGNQLGYKYGRVSLICDQCGGSFDVKKHEAGRDRENRFCSKVCEGLFRRGDNFSERKSLANARFKTPEHQKWRAAIFERDDFTCQECHESGGYLCAHHILPYRDSPDKIYDTNNGITLCDACHKKTYGREYQFVEKYTNIITMGLFAQECAFINRVNCWDISSETISSQACPVMDLKVQRLTPDALNGCVMETRVPYIQMDEDIVRACG